MILIDLYILIVTSLFLLYASYRDIKERRVSNYLVGALLLFGICSRVLYGRYDFIIPTIGMFLFGYIFWYFGLMGAADTKMLAAIAPLLPYLGFANMLVICLEFISVWGLLAGLYGYGYMAIDKKAKYIPMMPIFLIAYIIVSLTHPH